jgi:hypothetical protein
VFRHELRFDRSSLTRWRQRLGEERLAALLQDSLRVAFDTCALATKDLERVVVDTTVQPKGRNGNRINALLAAVGYYGKSAVGHWRTQRIINAWLLV